MIIVVVLSRKHVMERFDNINQVKYSNTQGNIGDEYKHVKNKYINMDPKIISKIEKLLEKPPENSDKITYDELTQLLEKKKQRNSTNYKQIYNQAYTDFLTTYLDIIVKHNIDIDFIDIDQLSQDFINIDIYIYILKKYHDRPRPTVLMKYMNDNNIRDEELLPFIKLPTHPAYPSGHATQCKFLAEYLSNLDPKNKTKYHDICEHISSNRELAGLHYRSDTEAGYKLGKILYKALSKNVNPWELS